MAWAAARISWEPEISLWLRVPVLGEFASPLLKGGERHPRPLRQKAQVPIAAQRSLMTEFAREITHTIIVLEIPGRQVRWQPVDLEGARCRARLERPRG